jgi:hypothetical protein
MMKEWDGEKYVVVDTRRAEVLAQHALVEIRCDHERGLDMPVCNCAVTPLGWHESVQEAKLTWARHALAAVDALNIDNRLSDDARRDLREQREEAVRGLKKRAAGA